MASFEELKETCTDLYTRTPVKSGKYFVMPNTEKPAFLVPAYSQKAFRAGIQLIKPITRKGDLKKRLLSMVPVWILSLKFKSIKIDNPNEGDDHTLILPWNQDPSGKVTIIKWNNSGKDVQVQKYAFKPETRDMVRNERSYLNKLKGDVTAKIIVPEVVNFEDNEQFTLLEQEFYFGEYVEEINTNILSFFDKLNTTKIVELNHHPYLNSKWPKVKEMLKEFECNQLLDQLQSNMQQFQHVKFQVATMHSDFSTTNTVHTKDDKYVIIDWEDAEDEGINIDVPFFRFRRHLYLHGSWKITNAESFLVVFHYVWFMVSKRNKEMLRQFQLRGSEFSI
ncbi:MAG: hypothetical protein HRT74_08935 [Flavobacteriales bacterium]|nr:hypothetical protein [Flavobacteriales bacterium]